MNPTLWSVNGTLVGVDRKGDSGNGVVMSSDSIVSVDEAQSKPEGLQWVRYQREVGHPVSMKVVKQDGRPIEDEAGTVNVRLTDEDYMLVVKDKTVRLIFNNKGNEKITLSTSTVIEQQDIKSILGISKNESITATDAANGHKISFPIYFDSVSDQQLVVIQLSVFKISVFLDTGLFMSFPDSLPRMLTFTLHNTKHICATLKSLLVQFLTDCGITTSDMPRFSFGKPDKASKAVCTDDDFVNSRSRFFNSGRTTVRMICNPKEITIDNVTISVCSMELDREGDEMFRYAELSKKLGIKMTQGPKEHLILSAVSDPQVLFPASWRFVEAGKKYKSHLIVEDKLPEGVRVLLFENRLLTPKTCWKLAADGGVELVCLERVFSIPKEPFSLRIKLTGYNCCDTILKSFRNIFGNTLTLGDYSIVYSDTVLPTNCTYTDFLREEKYVVRLHPKPISVSHITSRFRPKVFDIPVGATHSESVRVLKSFLGIHDKIRINKRAGGQTYISWEAAVRQDDVVVTRAGKKILVSGDRSWSGWQKGTATITMFEGDESDEIWAKISTHFDLPKIAADLELETKDFFLNTVDCSEPIRKVTFDGLVCGCEFLLCLPTKHITVISSQHRTASVAVLPDDDHAGVVRRIESNFSLPSKKIRIFGPYASQHSCLQVIDTHPKTEQALSHGSLSYGNVPRGSSWYVIYIPKFIYFEHAETGELSRPVAVFFNTSFPDILEDLCTAWSQPTSEPTVLRTDEGEVELLNYFTAEPLITYTASWEPVHNLRSSRRSGR
eukprot:TRINITY_DN18677_c0_g1_i1.p1 TRINITY_DN18677_c0_g1~~TRINITY_DN18677_c0_g1_i1.p1  ORF type:complete len:808 (+),score=125.51 TRINITY_DN18677_c0_g1_i1:82-2424(+)